VIISEILFSDKVFKPEMSSKQ